jgi:hypothetical protein
VLDGDRDGGAVQSVAVPGLPPVVADPGAGDVGEAAVVTPPGDWMHGHRVSTVRWPDGSMSAVCQNCGAGVIAASYGGCRDAMLDEPPCRS